MITAGQGERGDQALRSHLLDIGWRDGEVVESLLYLFARQGPVTEFAHGRAERLRGEKAGQHTPDPIHRADVSLQ